MYSRTKSDSRDDDVTGSGTRPGFMSVTLSVLSQNKFAVIAKEWAGWENTQWIWQRKQNSKRRKIKRVHNNHNFCLSLSEWPMLCREINNTELSCTVLQIAMNIWFYLYLRSKIARLTIFNHHRERMKLEWAAKKVT